MASLAHGKPIHQIVETGGRVVSLVKTPMADGGWVVTHEDITAQHKAEQERDSISAQEARRKATDAAIASFRERVEAVLATVGDSAAAMKATATSRSGSSGEDLAQHRGRSVGLERSLDQRDNGGDRGGRIDALDRRDQPPVQPYQ